MLQKTDVMAVLVGSLLHAKTLVVALTLLAVVVADIAVVFEEKAVVEALAAIDVKELETADAVTDTVVALAVLEVKELETAVALMGTLEALALTEARVLEMTVVIGSLEAVAVDRMTLETSVAVASALETTEVTVTGTVPVVATLVKKISPSHS